MHSVIVRPSIHLEDTRHPPITTVTNRRESFHQVPFSNQIHFDRGVSLSTILIHELLVELDNAANPLGTRSKEGSAEVQATLLLTEPRTRNNADAGSLEELHAVELVGGAALLGGGLGGLGGQVDGREEVHGTLGSTALDALHLLKRLVEGVGALPHALVDAAVLLLVELVGGLAGLGRVDHQLDQALANDRRAEHDADELVDFSLYFGIKVDQLKVATAVAALAHHALGNGVEGSQLDAVVLAVGVLLLQLAEHALERDELADEDVGLVDFVGEDDEALLARELEDGADVLLGEGGAGGVAGVDDDDGASVDAGVLGLLVRLLDGVDVGAPILGLIEEVGNAGGVQDGERGGVERVLGDGNQDAALLIGADDVQEGVDSRRSTGREVDVLPVGREAIAP